MLISKHHLRTRHTASTDTSRPLLTNIEVLREGDEVVAVSTDGYVLSEVRETVPADEEFPIEAEGVDHIRITAKTAAKLSSAMKPSKHIRVLGYAHATTEGVVTTTLEQTSTFADAQVEGKYPDYKELLPGPKVDSAGVVLINPELLMRALKLFKGEAAVELSVYGGLKPLVLRSDSKQRKILGVVMPLKS